MIDRFVRRHLGLVLLASVLVPFAVSGLLSLQRDSFENTNAALLLVLLVVGVASLGLRLAGLLAALSSAVWFDFFLTAPYDNLAILDRADIETAILLLLIGVAVTELALWGRRQQDRASQRQGYLKGVLTAAIDLGTGSAPTAAVVEHVEHQLVEMLDLDRAKFSPATKEPLPTFEPDGTLIADGLTVDVDRHGLPTMIQMRLPARSGGVPVGEFRLTAASHLARPTLEQRQVAVLLADQVGVALKPVTPER